MPTTNDFNKIFYVERKDNFYIGYTEETIKLTTYNYFCSTIIRFNDQYAPLSGIVEIFEKPNLKQPIITYTRLGYTMGQMTNFAVLSMIMLEYLDN